MPFTSGLAIVDSPDVVVTEGNTKVNFMTQDWCTRKFIYVYKDCNSSYTCNTVHFEIYDVPPIFSLVLGMTLDHKL